MVDIQKEIEKQAGNAAGSAAGGLNKDKESNNRCNAVLEVDGFKKRKIHKFDYEFDQSVDKDNQQPLGTPRGKRLKITVEAFSQEENVELLNWMVNRSLNKKGKITVYKPSDPDSKLKTIEFEDAYCVNYKENWEDVGKSSSDKSTNLETIEIIWKKLKVGPVEYENDWT
jgi:hypothetical protein